LQVLDSAGAVFTVAHMPEISSAPLAVVRRLAGSYWSVLAAVSLAVGIFGAASYVTRKPPRRRSVDAADLLEAWFPGQTPALFRGSFEQAVEQSVKLQKLLCAYFAVPAVDGAEPTRPCLCEPSVRELLSECCVVWVGSLSQRDCAAVARQLGVVRDRPAVLLLSAATRRGPYLAPFPSTEQQPKRLVVLARLDETAHADALLAALLKAGEWREWQQRIMARREENRRIREEQDREYEAALAADVARLDEERAAQERKRQEEEEERRREQERAERLQLLPPEPAAGSAGCVSLRVRLPDGGTVERRFPDTATLNDVNNWIESHPPVRQQPGRTRWQLPAPRSAAARALQQWQQ